MTSAKKQGNGAGEDNALKAITRASFHYTLHLAIMVLLIPIVIGSFLVMAVAVDASRELLYRSMPKNIVGAITPFIVCAAVVITWLLDGYIGYRIMLFIKRAAHRE